MHQVTQLFFIVSLLCFSETGGNKNETSDLLGIVNSKNKLSFIRNEALCKELVTFTPNMCDNRLVKEKCVKICTSGIQSSPGKYFTKFFLQKFVNLKRNLVGFIKCYSFSERTFK